jgi:hypothetical protein
VLFRSSIPGGSNLFIKLKTMSIIIGSILFLALLVGIVATGIAIATPRLRVVAAIVAGLGFLGAAACAGVFIFVVSRMN